MKEQEALQKLRRGDQLALEALMDRYSGYVTAILCNLARVGLAYAMSLTPLGLYGLWLGVTLGAVARGLLTYFWSCLLVRNIQRKAIA